MTWQNAKAVGEEWAKRVFPMGGELKGRTVQLASFETEEDCRFFHPKWSKEFSRMVANGASRTLRKAGAKMWYLMVTPATYTKWLGEREDTEAARSEYIKSVQQVIN